MPIYRCFANLPRICQFSNSTSIFRISPIMQVLVKSEEYFRKGPCNYLAVWTIYWCEKGHIEIFTSVLRSARDQSSNWNAYSNTRYKWVYMRSFVSRMENRKNTRQLLNLKWILSSVALEILALTLVQHPILVFFLFLVFFYACLSGLPCSFILLHRHYGYFQRCIRISSVQIKRAILW